MFKRIQMLMLQNGYNQSDLAKYLGISPGNVSDWAHGRSFPNLDKLNKMSELFGVSIDYLTGKTDNPHSNAPKLKDKVDYEEDVERLVEVYASLNVDGKAIVLGTAYQQLQRLTDFKKEQKEIMNDAESDNA